MGMIATLHELLHILRIRFQGLTCLFLDHTPSIEGGTINDVDVPSDIQLSLFCTWHHP